MDIVEFLSKLGFVALFFSATIALLNWRLGLYNAIRTDMKAAWTAFIASPGYAQIKPVVGAESEAITFLPDLRVAALTLLQDLEVMAAHDRGGRVKWREIIPPADYAAVQQAFRNAQPLVILVRETDLVLELQVWFEDRRKALCHSIRAFGKKRRIGK